jgi:hypothetical protein
MANLLLRHISVAKTLIHFRQNVSFMIIRTLFQCWRDDKLPVIESNNPIKHFSGESTRRRAKNELNPSKAEGVVTSVIKEIALMIFIAVSSLPPVVKYVMPSPSRADL